VDEEEELRKYRAREKKFREDLEAKRNMTIVDIDSDGNCMFGSVAFVIYGDEEYKALVRNKCMDYILANKDYFKDYIDLDKFLSIEHYC